MIFKARIEKNRDMKFIGKIITILFLLVVGVSMAQTEIAIEDYENNLDDAHIGKRVFVELKTKEKLKAGDYVWKFSEGNQPLAIWFTVLLNGEIDGEIIIRKSHTKEGGLLGIIVVKNGVVEHIKEYDQELSFLSVENYKKQDTLITKNYNKNKVLTYESKKINHKKIYEYRCSSYIGRDEIIDCTKEDFLLGVKETYNKTKLIKRLRTKKIPTDIKSVEDDYSDAKGVKRTTIFENGNIKTVYPEGNYKLEKPIKGGAVIEEYDKRGKLLKSDEVYDITEF